MCTLWDKVHVLIRKTWGEAGASLCITDHQQTIELNQKREQSARRQRFGIVVGLIAAVISISDVNNTEEIAPHGCCHIGI
jgi:hypothetical protein